MPENWWVSFFILAKEIAYLAATYTDITGRNILVWSDMAIEFVHESLAEAHDFCITFATRREVGTAFCTAHRQGCQ